MGPGDSTLALSEAAPEVVSLEEDEERLKQARLRFANMAGVAILKAQKKTDLGLNYLAGPFDLALVDGPYEPDRPPDEPARWEACRFACERAPVVILHDAKRPGEQLTCARLEEAGWQSRMIPTEKGLFVFWRDEPPRFPQGF